MRPPDQIPDTASAAMKSGDTVYLWHDQHYSRWTLAALHDFQDAITIKNGVGPMIVKRTDVITEHGYLAEKLEDDTEDARQRYAEIITHWNNGLKTSKAIAEKTGESARAIGQMIAAAKRWGLIADNLKP